jgi:hypothetical protein
MYRRADWDGILAGKARGQPARVLVSPLQKSQSGAATFLGLVDSGEQYWMKVLGNPQGDQVLTNEQIVSAAGALIKAPVRPTALIEIPLEVAGWQYGETERLRPGVAHGSLHLESADLTDLMLYQQLDDNANRQPALLGLWDWCLGEDEQWLYDLADARSIWTFDHGLWIGGGFDWDANSIARTVDTPWSWPLPVIGMNPTAFHQVADTLEGVSVSQIVDVIRVVPLEWGIPDSDLEAVGWMLYRRREPVAMRLRQLAARA